LAAGPVFEEQVQQLALTPHTLRFPESKAGDESHKHRQGHAGQMRPAVVETIGEYFGYAFSA
jgi:hypothetical protein